MAELLCRAKAHWMDDFKKEDIDRLNPKKKQSYEARSQIGDVIVVKPDGWKWGKAERPPEYVVVKLPGVSLEDAKFYEESLMDVTDLENQVLLKRHKYAIPTADVDNCKVELNGKKEMAKAEFDSKLITKVEK